VTVANWMLGAALAAMPIAAIAAPAPPVAAPAQAPLPDNAKVVSEVRALIARDYVVPDMRKPLDAALARGLAAGRYANVDPMELSNRLTGDMGAVAHDKHLYIHFSPEEAKSLATSEPEDASDIYFGRDGYWAKIARDNNQGVLKLEVLDGNVRYLNYRAFFWAGEPTKAAIDQAMAFLRGGDAIVIDLRNNGGGSPEAVRYLASYFVAAGTKLVTFYLKQDPPTTSIAEAVPGGVIIGKPVYVLTSGHTASAAEEFSSHVAGFGFGKLVGETTAGAAYRNDTYAVAGAYVLSLSIGRPELPKGGNWEEKGVAPAIAIAQDKALNAAQSDALETLAAKAAPADRTELSWLGLAAKARGAGPMPTATMVGYVGKYGGVRSVTVVNDQLHYRREGGIETTMLPIGPDLFTLDADPRTHLRFVRKDGAITGLEFLHLDGTSNIVAKD
jgi:hypothetical protein